MRTLLLALSLTLTPLLAFGEEGAGSSSSDAVSDPALTPTLTPVPPADPPPPPPPPPDPEAERIAAANALLERGWKLKSEGDLDGAAIAFERALTEGADEQLCHLELGYIERDLSHIPRARFHWKKAEGGPDPARAKQARGELKLLPKLFWGDLYIDLYGWDRLLHERSVNLVPTGRLRGFIHPIPKIDLDPYLFVQASRDVASREAGPQGFPLIYADNTILLGGGVLFRFWQRRIGLFAQVGPAIKLIDDGGEPVLLDVRVGAYMGLSSPGCAVGPLRSAPFAKFTFKGCAENYDEIVYVSRFAHDVVGMFRGRLSFTWLLTGPVAWQEVLEGRLLKDVRNDYWNNLVDVGVGHRWRLLWPFGLDVMLGIHAGSYMGLQNRDPVPNPKEYLELRLQAATYVAF